jgi:hypothetical protein
MSSVSVDGFRHLHGQLAGGNEDERGGSLGARAFSGSDPLQDREGERGRLPGAGRGLSEEIAAGQKGRNRLALDRCRLLVPELRERGEQSRIEPERGEAVRGG